MLTTFGFVFASLVLSGLKVSERSWESSLKASALNGNLIFVQSPSVLDDLQFFSSISALA